MSDVTHVPEYYEVLDEQARKEIWESVGKRHPEITDMSGAMYYYTLGIEDACYKALRGMGKKSVPIINKATGTNVIHVDFGRKRHVETDEASD